MAVAAHQIVWRRIFFRKCGSFMSFEIKEEAQINLLKECIIRAISPLRIYLFGSFAKGTTTADSDYDFYVVVENAEENTLKLARRAYHAMRGKKNRPVDIIVVRKCKFEERKNWKMSLEREVKETGLLLYEKL